MADKTSKINEIYHKHKLLSKIFKRALALFIIVIINFNSFSAVVSSNDGSAFITKAEFDALVNDFNSRIEDYEKSIDAKIDGAIAEYLAGLSTIQEIDLENLVKSEVYFADFNSALISDFKDAAINLRILGATVYGYVYGYTPGRENAWTDSIYYTISENEEGDRFFSEYRVSRARQNGYFGNDNDNDAISEKWNVYNAYFELNNAFNFTVNGDRNNFSGTELVFRNNWANRQFATCIYVMNNQIVDTRIVDRYNYIALGKVRSGNQTIHEEKYDNSGKMIKLDSSTGLKTDLGFDSIYLNGLMHSEGSNIGWTGFWSLADSDRESPCYVRNYKKLQVHQSSINLATANIYSKLLYDATALKLKLYEGAPLCKSSLTGYIKVDMKLKGTTENLRFAISEGKFTNNDITENDLSNSVALYDLSSNITKYNTSSSNKCYVAPRNQDISFKFLTTAGKTFYIKVSPTTTDGGLAPSSETVNAPSHYATYTVSSIYNSDDIPTT